MSYLSPIYTYPHTQACLVSEFLIFYILPLDFHKKSLMICESVLMLFLIVFPHPLLI